jgi:hypothetical protein
MIEIQTRHLPSTTQKRHHLSHLAASTLSNAENARDPVSSPQRGRVCVPHKKSIYKINDKHVLRTFV